MPTQNLLESSIDTDTLRRWLLAPETSRAWLRSAAVWIASVVSLSLLVGWFLGQPEVGFAAGIVLGGLCGIALLDRLWKQLEPVQ